MFMTLKENIRRLRQLKDWTQEELARRAGVSQQSIEDIESGRTKRPRAIHEIAAALGTHVEVLDPERFKRSVIEKVPASMYGIRDLPVFASAEGGEGSMLVSFDPIAYTDRPAPLHNVSGAYAIYIVGDSMIPAYDPGDTAWVNPHLPPSPTKDAIFYQSDGNGQSIATIKRIVRVTSSAWIVKQYNPPMEISLDRSVWTQCHIVVGCENR
jgi:phage repressor protein C with HTH and peptisase S24 domain